MAIQTIKANTNIASNIGQELPQEEKKKGFLNKKLTIGGPKVSTLDISLTMRHIAIMLRSGLSLAETLVIMAEQAHNEYLQQIYKDVYSEVQEGISMATAMKKYPKIFDKVMLSLVDVGEQGGTLERNLLFLADFLKQNHELNSKVKGALTYPIIVFFFTMAEMLGVIFFIFPTLEDLFSSFKKLPPMTKLMMDFSHFVRQYALPIVIVLAVIGFIIYRLAKTPKGAVLISKVMFKMPIIKDINKAKVLTNFSRTLGILLESGIPIVNALGIARETVSNKAYEEVLALVWDDVESGDSLSSSLAKYPDFFPGTYVKMLQVGEETGALEENLMYLFDFYATQVKDMSDNMATILEPILLIFIGLMIGALAIFIILPIYQLTGSINEGV